MIKPAAASAPAADGAAAVPRTPWGAPDLSGIWNGKNMTPLERPAKFADREFLTDEEIAAIERERGHERGRDVRAKKGTARPTPQPDHLRSLRWPRRAQGALSLS
jgi:hypothetical protein